MRFMTQLMICTMVLTKVTVGVMLDWGAMLSSSFACLLFNFCPHIRSFSQTVNSLGSEFSSQGHFHTLQLLNVPHFLFCGLLGSKLLPEVISAIIKRCVTLTTPTNLQTLSREMSTRMIRNIRTTGSIRKTRGRIRMMKRIRMTGRIRDIVWGLLKM